MRNNRRWRGAAGVLALVAAAVVPVIVHTAPGYAMLPATSTPLPGTGSSMEVDAATQHVFVSSKTANSVSVLDFDGNVVTTIAGEAGAAGMALISNHLYVLLTNAGAIDEIDTGSLTRTRTLPLSSLITSSDLVYAANALWTTTQDGLTRMDPVTGVTSAYAGVADGTGLASRPGDATTLFTYTPGTSPVTIARIDLTTTPPTRAADQWEGSPVVFSNVNDLAVSPDGAHVVPAAGAPYDFYEFRSSDLQASGVVYPANAYPIAVTMTSAAGGLFAGGIDGTYDRDIVVYGLDQPGTLLAEHDFGSEGSPVPHGVAFSPDGSRLFVVVGDTRYYQAPSFHVLTLSGPLPPGSTTTTTSTTSSTTTSSTSTTSTTQPAKQGPSVVAAPTSLDFGDQRVGTYGDAQLVTLTNRGDADAVIDDLGIVGDESAHDFFGATDCFTNGSPAVLAPGTTCRVALVLAPTAIGARSGSLAIADNGSPSVRALTQLKGNGTEGYYLAGAHGEVGNFGDAAFFGDATTIPLNAPIVSLTTTPNGDGYWLLGRDGGIFSYGNATFHGSTGNIHLNQPVVGLAATPTGEGYWLVASDGGIFAFGDAAFYGSTGNIHLNKPIVGMAPTTTGRGYWLVASDGGIFAFGDAAFFGSTGDIHLNKPIVGMATTPTGRGYWMVASDGGIFAFGDAHYYGSTGNIRLNLPIAGMAPTPAGHGYWLTASDGGIFSFGDAPYYGSLGGRGIDDAIGIAGTAPPLVTASAAAASAAAPMISLRSSSELPTARRR